MLMLSLGDTVIPEGVRAPLVYPDIILFIIGGPPKTKILQPTEMMQIKYRVIRTIIMPEYFLLALQHAGKAISQ